MAHGVVRMMGTPIPIFYVLLPLPFKSKYRIPIHPIPFPKNRHNVLHTDDIVICYRHYRILCPEKGPNCITVNSQGHVTDWAH